MITTAKLNRAVQSARRAFCAGIVNRKVRIAPDLAVITTRLNVIQGGQVRRVSHTKLCPVDRRTMIASAALPEDAA